jgi:hypothetical protein
MVNADNGAKSDLVDENEIVADLSIAQHFEDFDRRAREGLHG